MWVLSGGAIDPRRARDIKWRLYLPEGLQYYHAAVFDKSAGHWTVAPGGSSQRQASAAVGQQLAAFKALRDDEED